MRAPLYANLMLGFPNSAPADARSLVALIDALPAGTTWAAAGLGAFQAPVNALAIAMGGHVRTGLEDNPWLDAAGGRPATNAGLVERAVAWRPRGRPLDRHAGRDPIDARPAVARARDEPGSGRPPRLMQIVAAAYSLAGAGGSETYAVTVADHLQRLGHDVWLHTLEPGRSTDAARALGLRVATAEHELPAQPDVLLVQDGPVAYELAARHPATPQAFVAHSDIFDLQLPPQLPDLVAAAIVLYDRVEQRVRALARPPARSSASRSPSTSSASSRPSRCARRHASR